MRLALDAASGPNTGYGEGGSNLHVWMFFIHAQRTLIELNLESLKLSSKVYTLYWIVQTWI